MRRFVVKVFPEEREELLMHLECAITEACEKVAEEHNNDWCAWCGYLNKATELYEFYQKLRDAEEGEE